MYHPSTGRRPSSRRRPAASLAAAVIAASLAAPADAQQPAPSGAPRPDTAAAQHAGHEHAGHEPPAARPPGAFGGWQARRAAARAGDAAVIRAEQSGLAVEFSARDRQGGAPRAGRDATVQLRVTDAASGAPVPGVELAGWIDRRADVGVTPPDACKASVDQFVQSGMSMEGAIRRRAVEDLNSYFVLTLNRTPDIAVLDPFLGFGRTKLYTTVPLKGPGADWAMNPEGSRLFVSTPAAGEVAVIDAATWKVVGSVPVPGAPSRLAFSPDGRRLWVFPAERAAAPARPDTLSVVDAATLRVVGRVPLGAGAHAVAFDDAGATAFVTNRASGTVTVVDAQRMTRVADVPVGARPASVAYSAAARAAYVVVEGDGSLVAVDGARRAVSGRVALGAGAQLVRAAPAPGGHHGHGGKAAAKVVATPVAGGAGPADPHAAHGAGGSPAAAGRLLFVTSPGTKAVHIVDAAERRVLRTMRFEDAPDRVAFTGAFAYVRFADSPKLRMVSLDDPMTGGFGSLDVFEAGQKAPGGAAGEPGDPLAPAPDMPDAIYALNAAERMVYYYHYMEGMPIPSGGLTTYHYEPRAVLVAGKALRERAPGTYSATVRVDEPGEYDLVLLVPSPRVVQCFPVTVRADSAGPRVRPALTLRHLPAGRDLRAGVTDTVRFELADARTGRRRVDVTQLHLLVTATNGWRQQTRARHVGDGVFEAALAVPDRGAYYVSFAAPALGITYIDRPPAVLRASGR